MKKIITYNRTFFSICFSLAVYLLQAQKVGNMQATWLPATSKVNGYRNLFENQADSISHFLTSLAGSFRPLICKYNKGVLTSAKVITNGQVTESGTEWVSSLSSSAMKAKAGIIEVRLKVQLKSGTALNTGIAAAFDFNNWDRNNYVLIPGAAYNGNRFRVLPVTYPPYIYSKADKPLDMPVTVGNIIRLNDNDNPAKMEFLTGSTSIPMLSFYNPIIKRGFVVLTNQGTANANNGLMVEENNNRRMATFVISAPGVREKRYQMLGFTESGDEALNWKAGDELILHLKIYNFEAPDLPSFFDRVFSLRKDFNPNTVYRNIEPFSSVTSVMLQHRDSTKWYETKDYGYIAGKPWLNIPYTHFHAGYSMIYSYPYVMKPTAERIRRVGRTLDVLARIQGKTGLAHGMFMKSEIIGNNWDSMYTNPHIALIRRAGGESLYWGLQILELMKMKGFSDSIKPEWEQMFRKMADGLVNIWDRYGQFGQFVNVQTGEMDINGSSAGVVCATALVKAAQYFKNQKYMSIAEKAAVYYYQRDLLKGYAGGSPVEEMQSPDDESAHNFCDLYTVLYEVTGKRKYLDYAKASVANLATRAIPYDYNFPKGSHMHRIDARTTGALFANVQNTHGTPCLYIHSGDFLLKLYRATSDKRYVDLLKDITHNVVQYITTTTNPVVPGSPPGAMTERVQIGDWEGKEDIGNGLPDGDSNISWETGTLLAMNQNPGIYLRTDLKELIVFDHIEAKILKRVKNGVIVQLYNPTKKDAVISVFAEDKTGTAKPMGNYAFVHWPKVELAAGKTDRYFIEGSGDVRKFSN